MSQTIDHRVVEMRFDNKEFEAGAKQTVGTLGKLKEALKLPDSSKAFDELNKATRSISLDGISAGVDALNKRFGFLGRTVAKVADDIRDVLMNKVHAAVSFVTDSIVSGGIKRAMNIENAHFQLQALLKDEAKVQAVMADAMESVDGTAYAYDEAAKAASQFAASGLQAGEDMQNALKGITGVAAMTNSEYEGISRIFTTVAGQGRLMGDQLLQLSSRGMNAAATIANYFQEVQGQSEITEAKIREMVSEGEISFRIFADAMSWAFGDSAKRANETFNGALSNMKSALARIGAGFISPLVEQNGEVVKLFNALRIKINEVKSELVFDEQRSAIAGLAEATGITNDKLSEMFNTIKQRGTVSGEELKTLADNGVHASKVLMNYINGVNDGSIRATYAISSAIQEFTNGTKVNISDVRRFTEEGKIDLAMFTSAMESEFGKEKTLSKQFTDWFLDQIHALTDAVNSFDISKPMEIFYHWVEATKNLAKAGLSFIKPFASAFKEIFITFGYDDVIKFSEAIEKLTSKMRLSEKGSKNLKDTFKGLLSVLKLGVDIFVSLLNAILPIGYPISELGNGFLGLSASIGRGLSSFTEAARSSQLLNSALSLLTTGLSKGSKALGDAIKKTIEFASSISKLSGAKKLANAIANAFQKLSKASEPYIKSFVNGVEEIAKSVFHLDEINLDVVLENISNVLSKLASVIDNFTFNKINLSIDGFMNKLKALETLLMSNQGLATFVKNAKEYGEALREAFTLDEILKRIDAVMSIFGKFFKWITTNMRPAFEEFEISSAIAAAGGFGIIAATLKIANALSKGLVNLSTLGSSLTGVLRGVKGVLTSYQKDLNASALLKIAAAIAVLAGALVLLSFADTKRMAAAAVALGALGGALTGGISKLVSAIGNEKTANKLVRALQIKALGSAVKSFATSVAIIAASIIALGLMYKKDREAIMAGGSLVAIIVTVLTAMMFSMTLLGELFQSGMKNFALASLGMLSLSGALTLIVNTLNKLFKMEFPSDWEFKMNILKSMLIQLGLLSVVLGAASRLGGGNKIASGPILALAVMLTATVFALNTLFKMEFPSNWEDRVVILYGIFAAFNSLMIVLGLSSRLAGGAIKASGTILSMCLFLGVAVAALMVLAIMPSQKLIKGATALGIVLTTLGIALFGAGNIITNDSMKTVLAMTTMVGAITVALAVLGAIPFSKLLKSAVALGSILLIIGHDLNETSKISNAHSWASILAMILMVGTIATSLYILSEQPWEGLLVGAIGLGAVMLSLAQTFKMISDTEEPNIKKIGLFLLAATSIIPIGIALFQLSEQPWEGLLAAAASLSGTLLAFSLAFKIISTANPDLKAMGSFLLASALLGVIAFSLFKLSEQPWEGVIAAGESISMVLLAVSAAMGVSALIGTVAPAALLGMALFDGFIIAFAGVLALLGKLFQSPEAQALLSGGVQALITVGQGIGEFAGSIVAGVWTKMSSALPQIGSDLSEFMENLTTFIELSKNIDAGAVAGVGLLAGVIIALTAAEVVNGIASLFGLSLGSVADELSDFMERLEPFIEKSKSLKEETMRACQSLATMIITLTAAELLAGVTNFLGIGGSFSEFGDELEDFGEGIANFADKVKDISPESVQGAADAGEIMATLASKLPGANGFAQRIFGTKSLSDFGKELEDFGPSIATFADDVKSVTPESVQGAADAGEIMATLASKLPAQEGWANKVFGSRSLKDFGEELEAFGPSIVEFADEVSGVTPFSVMGAAAVANIMSVVANNLPDSASLWEKIFGGGKATLSQFGQELVNFGESMSSFSKSITTVNTVKIMSTIGSFQALADLSTYLEGKSGKNIADFAASLEKVSLTAIDKFLNAFRNSKSDIDKALTAFTNNLNSSIKTKFDALEKTMELRGKQIIQGINKGVSNNSNLVLKTVATLANDIDTRFRKVLEIRSPSKKGEESGNFYGQGVAEGLSNATNMVKNAAVNMGMQTTEGLASGLVSGGVQIKEVFAQSLTDEQNYWANFNNTASEGVEESEKLNQKKNTNDRAALGASKKVKNEGVAAEKDYWASLLAVKQAGADAEQYKSMTVLDFQKSILEETVKILEEYKDKMESARDSIMNTFGLFSEVSFDDALSSDALQNNLADQIRAYQNYDKVLGELNERLEGTALGEHLRTLGVESLEQLRVINHMTDEELSRYSDMYDQKLSAATKAAETQLSNLQTTTEEKLASLYGVMKEQVNLMDFSATFDGTFASINSYVTQITTKLSSAGESIHAEGVALGEKFVSGFWKKLLEDEESFSSGLDSTFAKLSTDNAEGATAAGNEIGSCITAGIGEGLLEDDGSLPGAAETILNNISEALKNAGEIHSPSERTAREVGVPLVQGISKGMTEETESVTTASKTVVDNIMTSFTSSETLESMKTAGQEMLNSFLSSFGEIEKTATSLGNTVLDNYINPFKEKRDEKINVVKQFVDAIIKALKENEKRYLEEGTKSAVQYITGIKNNMSSATSTGHNLANNALQAIIALQDKFLEAGINAGKGVVQGILENMNEATAAGRAIARAAYRAAMEELDEESPSKKMRKVGSYAGEGFVIGIRDWISKSEDAGSDLGSSLLDSANQSIKSISDMVMNEMDVDPIITPQLDLSEVKKSANDINDLFNQAIRVTSIKAQDANISVKSSKLQREKDQNGVSEEGSNSDKKGATYQFIQNNTSPKALSRIEIYRQTRAQFERFKEEMSET